MNRLTVAPYSIAVNLYRTGPKLPGCTLEAGSGRVCLPLWATRRGTSYEVTLVDGARIPVETLASFGDSAGFILDCVNDALTHAPLATFPPIEPAALAFLTC